MSRVSQCAVLVSVWVLSGIASASADPYSGRYGYDRGGNYPPAYTAPLRPPVSIPPAAPRYGDHRGPYAAQPHPYAAQPNPYPAQPYAAPPPTYVVIAPNAQIFTAPPYGALPTGWVYARPANCGEYRYWDGRECLDARDYPPDLSVN